MSYENAPATILLATHCAACARPLVDSVSVEAGMGPDCRKKYMKAETSPENRAKANEIVHAIALEMSLDVNKGSEFAASAIETIRALGFEKLAEKLTKVCVAVHITADGSNLIVATPYLEDSLSAWRAIPGRYFDKTRKANVVPNTSKEKLWKLLQRFYPNANAMGPKGFFKIA